MRNFLFAIVAFGFFSGCGKTEDVSTDKCLTGETEEQCLERTMPATSSGDSDQRTRLVTEHNPSGA